MHELLLYPMVPTSQLALDSHIDGLLYTQILLQDAKYTCRMYIVFYNILKMHKINVANARTTHGGVKLLD